MPTRPCAPPPNTSFPLVHGDLARFNSFRFRQSEGQNSLINSSRDLGGINGWIQFVDAPEIIATYLPIDRLSRRFLRMPMTNNSQFTVVDRDFEAGFINAGHLRPDGVALRGGLHIRRRNHVLYRLLIPPR